MREDPDPLGMSPLRRNPAEVRGLSGRTPLKYGTISLSTCYAGTRTYPCTACLSLCPLNPVVLTTLATSIARSETYLSWAWPSAADTRTQPPPSKATSFGVVTWQHDTMPRVRAGQRQGAGEPRTTPTPPTTGSSSPSQSRRGRLPGGGGGGGCGGGACSVWVKEVPSMPTPLGSGLDNRVSDPRETQALVFSRPAGLCRCLHFRGSVYLPDQRGHGPLLTGKCSHVWEQPGPSVAGVPGSRGSWGANHLPPDPLDFLSCILSPLGSGNSARSPQVHQGAWARHACSCTMPHPAGPREALAAARMWGQG